MAGLGAKLFASNTVLTAAEVNGYLADQAIMRFASSAVRDAAFGGAGEPTLAEGMFCYLDDTNVLQSYTGSAWVSVASTNSWQTWATVLTPQTGSYTTATTDLARFQQIGKTVYGQIVFTIDSIGSASNNALFTLPIPATSPTFLSIGSYREIALNGLSGIISQESATQAAIRTFSNAASLTGSGNKFAGSFMYEAA